MADRSDSLAQNNSAFVSPGLVDNVRRQFAVHEDSVLATQLQDGEFASKYKRNCAERQLARCDVPLAKNIQTHEELERQQKQLNELQWMQEVMENDALVAQQLQSEDMIRKEQERIRQELKDQELARELQHKERMRYELRKQEKELRRQRKRLELEMQRQAAEASSIGDGNIPHPPSNEADSFDRTTAVVAIYSQTRSNSDTRAVIHDDVCDPSVRPVDIRPASRKVELQQRQDMELARRLQEQEHKAIGSVSVDHLREMEVRDAELARLLQEEEKLKQQRRSARRSNRHSKQPADVPLATLPDGPGCDRYASGSSHTQSTNAVVHSNPNYRQLDSPTAAVVAENLDSVVSCTQSSSRYASRPLPATPAPSSSGPDLAQRYSCNMSLARALDPDYDKRSDSRDVVVCGAGNGVQLQSASLPEAQRGLNVALREPKIVDWPESDESRRRKRSKDRQESSGRSRRRSTSRQRSGRSIDGIDQPISASFADNVDYEMQQQHSAYRSVVQPSENVFAAIDPTCNRSPLETVPQSGLPADINQSRRRAPLIVEDGYCNLDEIQAGVREMEVAVVSGQRRSSGNRDSRPASVHGNSNCRQQ